MRTFEYRPEQQTRKNTFLSIILSALLFVPTWAQAESSTSGKKNQQASPKHRNASIFVSMIQLIANPVKYNHKYVKVEGYLIFLPNPYYPQKEVDPKGVLYLTKEHADYKMAGYAIFLAVSKSSGTMPDYNQFDKKHVIVEGRYRHFLEEYSELPDVLFASSIRSLEKGPASESESP